MNNSEKENNMKKEAITHGVLEDLANRNDNWDKLDGVPEKVDLLIESKANKVEVDANLELKANKQQEAWITPTLLNGWENVASSTPIGYYKDTLGVVHFRGALKGGVDNTDAFVLPVGYRPSTTIRSVGMTSDTTVGRYDISALGVVRPYKGSDAYIYAVNVSFRAEV